MPSDEVRVWASMGTTIKTRDFENIKLDIGVSGIPIDATPEFLEEKLQEANKTLDEVVNHLAAELSKRLREDFGR